MGKKLGTCCSFALGEHIFTQNITRHNIQLSWAGILGREWPAQAASQNKNSAEMHLARIAD